MATSIAELEAVITADTSGFDSGVAGADAKLKSLDGTAKTTGANFGAASAAMAAGAVGIGVGIADAIGMAGDFQASMNEIGSVTGATGAEMAAFGDLALQIGQDTAFSAQEAAQAISELGKAGIPIPDIMSGAAMATASLAAAGGVDMPRAAEVMSNAMNVFGIEGERAADVADTLAGAANTSATDINSLAMGMAQVGPSAAGLGLSLEETVAQLALFADAGMQGSDAGTSMKTMLTSLTPSTAKAREMFYELGLSTDEVSNKFFDAQGNFVGMEQASETLYTALADLTDQQRAEALETLFGSDASRAAELTFQAQKAAVEGTGRGYASYLEAVQASGQATTVAEAKMAGMNGALEALSGSIDTAKIAFGMAFLPVIEQVAEKLAEFVNIFIGLPPEIQTVVSVVAAGAAGFLAIGSAIGFIIGPLGAFLGLLAPVAAGVAAIALPLTLVVAGIAALYLAYTQNFLGFADGVNAAVAGLMTGFNNLILLVQNVAAAFGEGGLGAALAVLGDAFGLAFSNLSISAQTGLQAVSDAIMAWVASAPVMLDGAWAAIQAGASAAWDAITATTSAAWGVIQAAVGAGIAALQAAVTAGWEAITAGVGPAWETVTAAVSAAWTTIQTTVSTALEAVKQIVSDAWVAVEASIAGALETAKATVLAAWSAIRETVALEMQTVTETVSNTWTGIETTISGILATIQSTISAAWDAITTTVTTALQAIQEATGVQFETIGTVISGAMEAIQTTISGAWEAIQGATTTVLQAITSAVTAQFDAIKTTITTAATEAKDGFISTLESMASEAITAVTGIKDGIVGLFADARSWLVQAGADIIGGLIDGILSMAGQVADAVASVVPTELSVGMPTLDFLGGGGGGGRTTTAPSGRGSGTSGARAAGGPVRAGLSYWVGEEGPEPFIPSRSGTIIPNDVAMGMMGGGGGGNQIIENLTVILPDVTTPQEFAAAMQDFARSNGVAAGRGVS